MGQQRDRAHAQELCGDTPILLVCRVVRCVPVGRDHESSELAWGLACENKIKIKKVRQEAHTHTRGTKTASTAIRVSPSSRLGECISGRLPRGCGA